MANEQTTQVYLASVAHNGLAEALRDYLKSAGYDVQPRGDTTRPNNRRAQQLGSMAVIVVWNQRAAQDEWVSFDIDTAQRFAQTLIVLAEDTTPLPGVLSAAHNIDVRSMNQAEVFKQVQALIPAYDDMNARLFALASGNSRERHGFINDMANNLSDSNLRQRYLILLEYLAEKDSIQIIRNQAQAAIDGSPSLQKAAKQDDSRFMIKVQCGQLHINYFDRRVICRNKALYRGTRTLESSDVELETFILPCQQKGCNEELEFETNCEGLR